MLTATPGSESVPVEGTCFQSVELTSKALESGDVGVTLHLGLPTSLLCHASFILATDKHIELEEVASSNIQSIQTLLQLWLPGDHTITFPAISNSTPAEDWDLYTRYCLFSLYIKRLYLSHRGPRIFLYPITPEEVFRCFILLILQLCTYQETRTI